MPNPLKTALRGKGIGALLRRGVTLIRRYGLTSAALQRALAALLTSTTAGGIAPTLPVTASALARHPAIARHYQAHGVEFAVHGLFHVDYAHLPLDVQHAHLTRARQLFAQAGIQAQGFRCPYLRWNEDTLTALRAGGFSYDSSQAVVWDTDAPNSETYLRALSFYGVQRAETALSVPRLEQGLVRIPYSLPDDEALVERLRLSPAAMSEIWLSLLTRTHAGGELFTLGLHPERTFLCQAALEAVLRRAHELSPGVWLARLDALADWQRALTQTTFTLTALTPRQFQITINAPPAATVLVRGLTLATPSTPWAAGYAVSPTPTFTFEAARRPVLGVSPEAAPALQDFLRQQGYLFEVSPTAADYGQYLTPENFSQADERPLLTALEAGTWPLIRVGRWPNAARSALAVTGDIDAFTLWDYGLRLWEH